MSQSRHDVAAPLPPSSPPAPMSGGRTPRTIYRSSSAAAAARSDERRGPKAGAAASAPARRRKRLRDAWWLAPLLALAIVVVLVVATGFFVLGGAGLLQPVGLSVGGHRYAGAWGTADTAIGGPVLRITAESGGRYTIAGLRLPGLSGGASVVARVQDDSLVATDSGSSGAPWRVALSFINRDQLRADLTLGDGSPAQRIVLTRQ